MTWTKGAAALGIALAISACAATSVRGMRERPPVLEAESTHTVTEVSQCIANTWVNLGHTPRTLPREHGTTLLVEQVVTYALPIMLVDLDTTATGTHIVMRQFKTFHAGSDRKRVDEVRACL